MQAVYEWIRNIVVFMILNTLIMNVFGDSNYKKYIRLVTGMILVIIVISPIIDFLRMSDKVDHLFEVSVFTADTSEFKSELKMMEEKEQRVIWEQYSDRVIEQAKIIVVRHGFTVKEADISFNTDLESQNFGEIIKMDFVVEQRKEDMALRREKITIDKIMISERKKEMEVMAPSPAEIILKNDLSDFYNMNGDNINISIRGGSYE